MRMQSLCIMVGIEAFLLSSNQNDARYLVFGLGGECFLLSMGLMVMIFL